MGKNTSVALGDYFENRISHHMVALKAAIKEGIDSGTAICFDAKKHLQSLKAKRLNG
jgi:hypothetical protein